MTSQRTKIVAVCMVLAALATIVPLTGSFIILLVTRALDVWLAALKAAPEAGALAALPAVFEPGPWLQVSWFLIVPLAVNAFVLCPIIIRRAQRSRRDPGAARPVLSLAVSATLLVATVAYLWLVAASA